MIATFNIMEDDNQQAQLVKIPLNNYSSNILKTPDLVGKCFI
jgi:hypothetical protein